MRKDKSVAGTRSILRKGYWPYCTPLGYTNENKRATADKHVYVINDNGKLIALAFKWKASGNYSNQEIVDRLALRGLNVTLRNLAWILANPFYCGYIVSSLLPGEIIKGKHPAIINEATFLKVNSIKQAHPVSGIPKMFHQDDVPLKVFAKDANTLSPFTGYLNKKKKLWYYKSRDNGSKVNVSAKKLNGYFINLLSHLQYDKKYRSKLKSLLVEKLQGSLHTNEQETTASKKRISELTTIINNLEERFVLGEISKDQFEKFGEKYKSNLEELIMQTRQNEKSSSNLQKAIEKALNYAENLSQTWVAASYTVKQKLQYLVFPEGILYDKENDTVRTSRINSLFLHIPLLARDTDENQKGNQVNDCLFGSNVGAIRQISNNFFTDLNKLNYSLQHKIKT